jgi:hypothetical protein
MIFISILQNYKNLFSKSRQILSSLSNKDKKRATPKWDCPYIGLCQRDSYQA